MIKRFLDWWWWNWYDVVPIIFIIIYVGLLTAFIWMEGVHA